jgi:hypothetical protein
MNNTPIDMSIKLKTASKLYQIAEKNNTLKQEDLFLFWKENIEPKLMKAAANGRYYISINMANLPKVKGIGLFALQFLGNRLDFDVKPHSYSPGYVVISFATPFRYSRGYNKIQKLIKATTKE